eukprot:gene7712-5411_t
MSYKATNNHNLTKIVLKEIFLTKFQIGAEKKSQFCNVSKIKESFRVNINLFTNSYKKDTVIAYYSPWQARNGEKKMDQNANHFSADVYFCKHMNLWQQDTNTAGVIMVKNNEMKQNKKSFLRDNHHQRGLVSSGDLAYSTL